MSALGEGHPDDVRAGQETATGVPITSGAGEKVEAQRGGERRENLWLQIEPVNDNPNTLNECACGGNCC
jgi:hypothetical protein